MDTYTVEELIPGYLGTEDKSDIELITFTRWLYNDVEYMQCNGLNCMVNPDDINKVNNLDKRFLNRLFLIFGVTPNRIITNKSIITKDHIPYIHTSKLVNYDSNPEAPAVIIDNPTLKDISPKTTHVRISNPMNNIITIPDHITILEINKLTNYVLHDNITLLVLSYLRYDDILPSNLIALNCNFIDKGFELPSSIKSLEVAYTSDIDIKTLPKDIEHLTVQSLSNAENISLKKLRYLHISNPEVKSYSKLYLPSLCPNLEVLIMEVNISSDLGISELSKLKVFIYTGMTDYNIELPEGLLYLYSINVRSKIPDSLRVLNTGVVNHKYPNLTTIKCNYIEEEYIPDNLSILISGSPDIKVKENVIHIIKSLV